MYQIELTRHAEKQLAKIHRADRHLYEKFLSALTEIGQSPDLGKPLKEQLKGLRSYRLGSYRIIYEIKRQRLLIVVIDLGHRREIYR